MDLALEFENYLLGVKAQRQADEVAQRQAKEADELARNQNFIDFPADKAPEMNQLLEALIPTYLMSLRLANPEMPNEELFGLCVDRANEQLHQHGFRGTIVLDENSNNIAITFGTKDKNRVISQAKAFLEKLNQGNAQGLDPVRVRDEAFRVMGGEVTGSVGADVGAVTAITSAGTSGAHDLPSQDGGIPNPFMGSQAVSQGGGNEVRDTISNTVPPSIPPTISAPAPSSHQPSSPTPTR